MDSLLLSVKKTIDINERSYESKLQQMQSQYVVIDQRLERIERALNLTMEKTISRMGVF